MKWPFASKQKALEHHLVREIKNLQEKLEDNELDEELRDLEYKSFSTHDGSSSISGLYGIVDEFYDKAHLQRLYATETWFFIAVHTIAKTIASLPLKLEKRKKILQNIHQSDGTVDKIQKEIWIDASAEPEYDILCHPNSIQSSVEFWMLIIIDLMATGDAFIYIDKGAAEESELEDENSSRARLRQSINKKKKSKIRNLFRLSAGIVRPMPAGSDTRVHGGYQINTAYGVFNFDVDEVIHIRLPNPNDPFYGLSPIVPVMKNLLLDKYSAEHMIRFYKQGARLGGVIKTGKKLTKDQLTRLERVFESNFTGKRNHHKTLILPEGMDYTTIEQNPGETSLIEFLKANKEPVLAAFNMPPIKVGLLDGATFANALIQDKTFYLDTINPICRIVEDSINQHGSIITKARELRFSFSFDEIEALQEDELKKSQAARGMLDSGLSINEVRERVWKLGPVDDVN
jgi:phage portal protein BeeE